MVDTDSNEASGTVRCELVRWDGATAPVDTFSHQNDYETWRELAAVDRDTHATARFAG